MKYKLQEFKDLITTGKTGFASDKITVDGEKIGYMYREDPEDEDDSGWRFYSGTEDDEFVANEDNVMIFDLNTIANYDNAIIPYLKKPIGTEWERVEEKNYFKQIKD